MSTSYVPMKLEAPIRLDMERSACRDFDPDLWFPDDPHVTRTAIRICTGCPIMRDCGEQAMRSGIVDGIYGGLTPEQRQQLRKKAS